MDFDAHPIPYVSEECKLATFLSLWLCRFIMLHRGIFLHLETFVMPTKFAQGTRMALAPAVLAYIYTSLDAMVQHSKGPCSAQVTLPYHFLYGWVDSYFEITYARRNAPSDNIININGLREIPSMAYI